jgi:DnaJ-class molecular chaperone
MSIHWTPLENGESGEVEWRDLSGDFYEILQVSKRASPEIIKRAYRTLIEQYHPDKHPPQRKVWAEEISKHINGAYEVLGDPQRKAAYDRELDVQQ